MDTPPPPPPITPENPPVIPTPQNKKTSLAVPLLIIAISIFVGFLINFFIRRHILTILSFPNPSPTPTSVITGYKTYSNPKLGFEIKFPNPWPEPEVQMHSTSTDVIFNQAFTVTVGVRYSQVLDRNLTMNEYL